MSLARRIPGCADRDAAGRHDATCTLRDGSAVTIATFTTAAAERAWLQHGGGGNPPDPSFAGCCVFGNGWAATVGPGTRHVPGDRDFTRVIRAIGGGYLVPPLSRHGGTP